MHDPLPLAAVLDVFANRPQPCRLDGDLQVAMRVCLEQQLDVLPLPGAGGTIERWQALAAVAGHDLALAKLFESHTDARATLRELKADALYAPGIWAIWAAEPPQARVLVTQDSSGGWVLNGLKAWCSGAAQIDFALVTAWNDQAEPQLVKVALDQPGVHVTEQGWHAVGMAATASVEVQFDGAKVSPVGAPGAYLSRPGFWHGGAGIAACWYGAAAALAVYLKECCEQHKDVHAQAHLGVVDATLSSASAALRECAAWIDANPAADAQLVVRRVRAQIEHAAETVLRHVGRAMGANPYCRDPRFARLSADLPVFMRQSHAERDLAELGRQVAESRLSGWAL